MDKIKIQEIADEAGLSNGDLLNKAKELDFNVKAANSTISFDDACILVDYAISGTLPKNLRKVPTKKVKVIKKTSKGIAYASPKQTKWGGITIVGKKAKTEITEPQKESRQVLKKSPTVVKSKKKKNRKRAEPSTTLKKLLDSFEDLRLKDAASNIKVTTKKSYTPSERSALKKGFLEITDPNAYNGRYFIKNEKIWIHDIGALKARLGVSTDQAVRDHGYDVETYYSENAYTKKSLQPKSLRMCDTKDGDGHCSYSLDDMVYMSDGMYIHKDDCWW